VVTGVGLSGQAAARWLHSQGADVCCSDMKPFEQWPPEMKQWCRENSVQIEAGDQSPGTCISSDLVVTSPGIPPDIPALAAARDAGVPVVGELALAATLWAGPLYGITGTNGKTTTTELVSAILNESEISHVTAGNTGTPLSGLLHRGDTAIPAVLEVSSFQADCIPSAACGLVTTPGFAAVAWLNLAPDHLDRYRDLSEYGASKARLFGFLDRDGWAVINRDDPGLASWTNRIPGKKLFFGTAGNGGEPGAWIDRAAGIISVQWPDGRYEDYSLTGWSLKGNHNLENLACAILISRLAGALEDAVRSVVNTFRAPAHRLEWIGAHGGVDYYDDSKATNVSSVLRAVESISQPLVLIAGGLGKGESYLPLGKKLRRRNLEENRQVRGLVAIGREATTLERELGNIIPVIRIKGTSDGRSIMVRAVLAAASMAEPGDAVLLSPACASFDLFRDYAHRGDSFRGAVMDMMAGNVQAQEDASAASYGS